MFLNRFYNDLLVETQQRAHLSIVHSSLQLFPQSETIKLDTISVYGYTRFGLPMCPPLDQLDRSGTQMMATPMTTENIVLSGSIEFIQNHNSISGYTMLGNRPWTCMKLSNIVSLTSVVINHSEITSLRIYTSKNKPNVSTSLDLITNNLFLCHNNSDTLQQQTDREISCQDLDTQYICISAINKLLLRGITAKGFRTECDRHFDPDNNKHCYVDSQCIDEVVTTSETPSTENCDTITILLIAVSATGLFCLIIIIAVSIRTFYRSRS